MVTAILENEIEIKFLFKKILHKIQAVEYAKVVGGTPHHLLDR